MQRNYWSKNITALLLFCCAMPFISKAQELDVEHKQWPANWIGLPGAADGYGVYLFRKEFKLQDPVKKFMVHVSGDNRYKLYVNGQLVSLGPARSDIQHWNYATLDLAPYLKEGKNLIAAKVWNEGAYTPEAQISYRTGFLLQGQGAEASLINTNNSWWCRQDSSYSPIPVKIRAYYVAGPGELIDYSKQVKGWENSLFDSTQWKHAVKIGNAIPKNIYKLDMPVGWALTPSTLPEMAYTAQRFTAVRKDGGLKLAANFPANKSTITIPANSTISILLDQGFLTNAYPVLEFAKGKFASIKLDYVEALFTQFPQKGNRNEVDGKNFIGREDQLISDGTEAQVFSSLQFRTFRYLQLTISTKDSPLEIKDIYSYFTGYPFERKTQFASNNPLFDQILDIGWRTARLCAWETYMDCPYYEQLQYIGDARIQAMISLYNTGDERLVRNALTQMDNSRISEGLTYSRHPSHTPQLIPTFSLWYIAMLRDYWIYGKDEKFVQDKLVGTRAILDYYSKYQQADKRLKELPYWNFTDWCTTKGWDGGRAPIGQDGASAVVDFLFLYTLQQAASMEQAIGMPAYATKYQEAIKDLQAAIWKKYWNPTKKLFADRAEQDLYSQHANTLAILTGTVKGAEAKQLGEKLMQDKSLTEATIFFKYYVYQALVVAGYGDGYLDWLGIWKENIQQGLTTWAEISDINNARSDCHAWGSSPNIEFFRTVLGIDSDAPGFKKVKIIPHLGKETKISGSMPHPSGTISSSYQLKNGKWEIAIELPTNTSGYLLWNEQRIPLVSGKNKFLL
jgi:alpha-L-rhamnosidase